MNSKMRKYRISYKWNNKEEDFKVVEFDDINEEDMEEQGLTHDDIFKNDFRRCEEMVLAMMSKKGWSMLMEEVKDEDQRFSKMVFREDGREAFGE